MIHNQDVVTSLFEGGGLALPTIDHRDLPEEVQFIPTGILPFDKMLGGGVKSGTFNIACAYTGEGKSSLMIHLAQIAAHMGHPVRIYHSEMNTASDYLPRLARWQFGEEFPGDVPAGLFPLIKIQDIRSHLDRGLAAISRDIRTMKAENDLTPLIIVDSLDRPGDDRQQLESFTRSLTDLTESEQTVTWATSQANDKARESNTVIMEHLRDSRGKAFPCSMFVGVRKCSGEEEDGNVVLTIDKNRHGSNFQLRCRVNWLAQRFSDVNDTYQLPMTTSNQNTRQICMPDDKSE